MTRGTFATFAICAPCVCCSCGHSGAVVAGADVSGEGPQDSFSDASVPDDTVAIDDVPEDIPILPSYCTPADYVLTIEFTDRKEDLRDNCTWFQGVDSPVAYKFISKTSENVIQACSARMAGGSTRIVSLHADPPSIAYSTKDGYMNSCGGPPTVTVTRWDAIGGIVEGTFEGDIGFKPTALVHVRGSFRACRVPDWHYFE